MKTNYLIYYVLKLITKGQEWQYKNLNGKEIDQNCILHNYN